MKTRKLCSVTAAVCMGGLLLTGCGGTKTTQSVEGLDRLGEIQVISREEGSGTRTVFTDLIGLEKTKDSDGTTETAQIAENAAEVITAVEKNGAAIGYVSGASLTEDNAVKALSIDGIAPDDEKRNPLIRTFYVVYNGTQSELEKDFLTYINGAGQALVAEQYTAVAKSNSFLSNQASGSIQIAGSTSVAPLMQELAEAYMAYNPNAQITVEATDSNDGLNRAMSGDVDWGMSSRDLEEYEAELLDYQSIARDPISVIVSDENPLNDISIEQLLEIYSGSIAKWENLNQ